ncbi:hypothetical protein [Actinomarinicola tropica]|uniref:Sensor domain-containing protein n=1 Tax=Actinomarinicola tropica TaxID=2789776 RepID=A0A5Q2RKP7_9ACTN|nr:hypothetical protein [Actinomarinicola tropica]QGG96403.1 hypothetical protein GH723_15570 [Actinomarinicola tropica]
MSAGRQSSRPYVARIVALVVAASLLSVGCGDGEEGAVADLSSLVTTTTGVPATTTTQAAPSSTTTVPPRPLSADDLRTVLLRPEDLPDHFVAGEQIEGDTAFVTDPADCGEALAAGEPADVSLGTTYVDPNVYLAYESYADHTPGRVDDLAPLRAALRGPCSEPFTTDLSGIPSVQRFDLLPDPDLGDDAVAARLEVEFVQEGHAVVGEAFVVTFQRDDVLVQVQAVTGDAPSAGLAAADLDLEDVLRVARRIEDRLAALQDGRGA